jgi:hypothetical protein
MIGSNSINFTGTVKILDHPWTLDLVLRRSRNACRSDGSTKSKDLERVSAPSLNSLAPVEVAKSKKAPAFAMAGERAKIGAAVPMFGVPVGGSPARAAVAAAAASLRQGWQRQRLQDQFAVQQSDPASAAGELQFGQPWWYQLGLFVEC